MNELITVPELSKLFKVNRTTIWRWTRAGKLTKTKYKNLVFYDRKQVMQYFESVKPMVQKINNI